MNCKASFAAKVAKLNAHGSAVSLHEPLLSMMLLAGLFIDVSQRISILSAASRRQIIITERSRDTVVSQTEQEDFTSVLCPCDTKSLFTSNYTARQSKISAANYAIFSGNSTNPNNHFTRDRGESSQILSRLE